MTENLCACCERPTADGYACVTCGITKPGEQLRQIADMTPAARDVAHGLSRRGGGGAGGKPGSRLPLDLGATSRLDAVANALGGWVRHIAEERGAYPASVPAGYDVIGPSARFLAEHLEWFRHRPEVDEFLADVTAAARVVASIARGPAAQRYLGPCGAVAMVDVTRLDQLPQTEFVEGSVCEGDIYAREGAATGYCRTCGADVPTDLRRAWLDDEVRAHAFRAAEIEEAYGVKANLIRQWATPARNLVQVHGHDRDGRALYLLSHVLDVAAQQRAKQAEAQAKRARREATRQTEDAA